MITDVSHFVSVMDLRTLNLLLYSNKHTQSSSHFLPADIPENTTS